MIASLARRALYALATSTEVESVVRANPPAQDLAYNAARRYVAGTTLDEALETVRRLTADGLGVSLDLFGEGAADEEALAATVRGYRAAAAALADVGGDVYLEIVPSHLGLDLGLDVCRRHVEQVLDVLPAGSRLEISAEESHRTPHIMDLTVALAEAGAPVLATVQANLRRSPGDVDRLLAAGVPIRLTKGAYLENDEVAYPWGEPTGVAYVRLAHQVHAGGSVPVLATHDRVLREALLEAIPGAGVELLLGVREDDARELAARGVPVRVYAPYGDSWFRYWMRRVAEAQGA
ncbi:proline dehydrogenase family protein [Jiangella sp. DSM 45060]|uniref:proline dehydrogenase family protein n=1 Tax=Jiangella sp. DSM 45060 TaxID=1798224 RepID=UPI00087BF128|nr:proline dehydrogenase family protein [Jiangella sp. DSM 45060]SDT67988.1 L-proline dehydrogenase [Jiangella sp. DSM 45060]